MTTTKQRINISITDDLRRTLVFAAQRDEMPVATKASMLINKALSIEEDIILEGLANARDTHSAKYIKHEDVWA